MVLYFAVVATRSANWWFVLRTLTLEALLALVCAPAVFAALDSYLPRSARQHAAE